MLIETRALVAQAVQQGSAVAAFNIVALEHAQAIAAAAQESGLPAILQISQNAVRFHGGPLAIAAAAAAVAEGSSAMLSLHLDHVDDPDLLHLATRCGVSSVMFDASHLPAEENLAATRDAVTWGHANGLWVEGELGRIGGKGGAHEPGVRTDPREAAMFVKATGVDALAVAVGSRHAMVRQQATLDFALIESLREAVPVPLVLHGSSGVDGRSLARAVAAGMRKINIGTILNVRYTEAIRAHLADSTGVDPRPYLGAARDAMSAVVLECQRTVAAASHRIA